MMRLFIIDHERLFVEGFRALLSGDSGIDLIGSSDGEIDERTRELIAGADVVTLDLRLNGVNGMGLLRELVASAPSTRVLVLTAATSSDHVLAAFGAGASGYALKEQAASEVFEAIREVAGGQRYLAPKLPRALLEGGGNGTALERLSPREREIFNLVVRGHSTQRIAEELNISVKTVETHRAHINRKIGAHSAADVLRYAVNHQLLT